MNLNVRQLARLRNFRASRVRLDESVFARQKNALDRLDQRIHALTLSSSLAVAEAAASLAAGDALQWRVAEQARAADDGLAAVLGGRRGESVAAVEHSKSRLLLSRQQERRAELLEEAARELLRQREDRAAQAAADDRFAARAHWSKARVPQRYKAQVK